MDGVSQIRFEQTQIIHKEKRYKRRCKEAVYMTVNLNIMSELNVEIRNVWIPLISQLFKNGIIRDYI